MKLPKPGGISEKIRAMSEKLVSSRDVSLWFCYHACQSLFLSL